MARPLVAAFLLFCALLCLRTSAHASRGDGHFALPENALPTRWTVTFHRGTGGAPEGDLLSYDGAGRLKQDAYCDYTWDAAGRLTGMVHRPGTFSRSDITAETVAFGYDADGRRTTKTHTTVDTGGRTRTETSKVLWAGWLPIMEDRTRIVESVVTNLPRRWFQWGADLSGTLDGAGGIGGLVAILEDGNAAQGTGPRTLLPVQDGLGNVTAVIDAASGQTVARYEYGPFGEPLSESGEADVCPFRWQTKWYDAESQHYYFGYRHYDPRLGRWLSRDPLGEAGGFNLYAYCGNDPVNRHDPLGLADRATVFDVLSPALASGFHVSPYGSQKAAIRRSVAVRVPILQAAAAAGNTARTAGGALEAYAGAAYTYATGGLGGWLGGAALMTNGYDNMQAGYRSLRSGTYQQAYLEKGITSVAGNGVFGNGLYVASQFGIGFGAPVLGSRVNSLMESNRAMVGVEISQGLIPLRSGESGYVSLPGSPLRHATAPLALPAPPQRLLLMDAPKSIIATYAVEVQSASAGARAALTKVGAGAPLYRAGNLGDSMTTESQYWSLHSPATDANYASGMGLPLVGDDFRFIMGGSLKPGASFITNEAVGLGTNIGGKIQVVTEEYGVGNLWFFMPD